MAVTTERSYARPNMAPSAPAPALTRHALIPLSLVICFALIYWIRVQPIWVVAVALPIVMLYLAAPEIGRRSLRRFDRDAIQLLTRGQQRALPGRFSRAIGMRLFSPPALVAERRGRAQAEAGEARRARVAFQSAFDAYPEDRVPVAVRLGLAHACFLMEDDREAIRLYGQILRSDGRYPRLTRNLAHALARRGEDLKRAERLSSEVLRASDDPEAKLIRALVHAKKGQRGPARKLLDATRDAPDLETLREDVEVAIEQV